MNAMQKTDQTQRTLPLHLASYTLIVIGLLTSIMLIGISTTNQISRAVQTGSQSLQGEDALEFLQQEGISQQLDLDKVDVESYIQTQKLTSSGGGAGDAFGISVAVSNDTIIVGAGNDTVGANPNQGSAYVFVHDGTTWRQQAHLTASDGATGDHFGWDVALDGETALIGAYSDDVNGFTAQGSVYVFVRNGTTWTQQAQLVAPDGSRLEWFGAAIALRGDTALVGAYLDDLDANKDQGSAYIFVRNGTTWTQQSKLVAADGSEGDLFGISVALSGEIALIGSHHNNIGSVEDQGSAYVFVRNGTTWTQQAQLTASDGAKADYFGEAVALAGETALIGAYGHAINGKDDQGAAYIFTRNGTTWTQQVKLIASNGTKGDFFGSSVALSEEHAIVGASADGIEDRARQGSAYAFIRDGATWTQHALLVGSDGATDDFFGTSVTISGETVVIGAYADDLLNNPDQGSAFVFTRSPLLWKETKVTTSDSVEQDEFGFSVALSGESALVGVPSDDVGSSKDQGSVYVFVRSGEVWTKQAQLIASDGATLDRFGDSVDLDGDTALIGAVVDDVAGTIDQGSAYVFVRNGTIWTQQAQLLATDGTKGDLFGSSVALHGDTAIIGAQSDSINSNLFQGSAYVFTRNGTTWTQQAQLIASDGAGVDDFGYSVDLDGDTALIGAVADDIAGKNEQGSAYVFTRNGTIWTQQAQLLATDGAASDFFGSAVALHGDTAIIGAQSDDVNSNLAQGSVYVFIRNGTAWTQQAQLNALDGAPSDVFGISLALGADIALIGAMNDRVGVNSNQGSVYVFARNGTAWTQQAQLIASDGARNDLLGTSVAFDGKTALIGVSGDNIGSNVDQGSAYFFEEINQTQSIFLPLVVR